MAQLNRGDILQIRKAILEDRTTKRTTRSTGLETQFSTFDKSEQKFLSACIVKLQAVVEEKRSGLRSPSRPPLNDSDYALPIEEGMSTTTVEKGSSLKKLEQLLLLQKKYPTATLAHLVESFSKIEALELERSLATTRAFADRQALEMLALFAQDRDVSIRKTAVVAIERMLIADSRQATAEESECSSLAEGTVAGALPVLGRGLTGQVDSSSRILALLAKQGSAPATAAKRLLEEKAELVRLKRELQLRGASIPPHPSRCM